MSSEVKLQDAKQYIHIFPRLIIWEIAYEVAISENQKFFICYGPSQLHHPLLRVHQKIQNP